MSITMSRNGQPRKQLADQLDRLDDILDCLGDGLTGAVAEAMKAGTALAVKGALLEILTNPELLAALRGVMPTPGSTTEPTVLPVTTGVRPGLWARMKARLADARSSAVQAVRTVRARLAQLITSAVSKIQSILTRGRQLVVVAQSTQLIRSLRWLGLTATMIGMVTGVVAYLTPHELLAAAGGVFGAISAAAVQVGYRARRFFRSMIPLPVY